MRQRLLEIFLLILLLSSAGCFGRTLTIELPNNFRKVGAEEAGELARDLAASRAGCRSFRSSAKVVASKGVVSESFRQITVFERPDRLRLDFFDPTRTTLLGLLVLRDGDFWFLDKENKRVIYGAATPANIARVASIPLSPSEMMDWICGVLPEIARLKRAYVSPDGEQYFVEIGIADARSMTALVSRQTGGTLKVGSASLADSSGKTILNMSYEYGQQQAIPSRVFADAIERDFDVEIQFDSPELNPVLSERARRVFDFRPPAGYRLELISPAQ